MVLRDRRLSSRSGRAWFPSPTLRQHRTAHNRRLALRRSALRQAVQPSSSARHSAFRLQKPKPGATHWRLLALVPPRIRNALPLTKRAASMTMRVAAKCAKKPSAPKKPAARSTRQKPLPLLLPKSLPQLRQYRSTLVRRMLRLLLPLLKRHRPATSPLRLRRSALLARPACVSWPAVQASRPVRPVSSVRAIVVRKANAVPTH